MHVVQPSQSCPHTQSVETPTTALLESLVNQTCSVCDASEVWLCCTCFSVNCSRYKNKHALQHFEETSHPIAISFSDLSVTCYLCDNYIVSTPTSSILSELHNIKFDYAPSLASLTHPGDDLQSLLSQLSLTPVDPNVARLVSLIEDSSNIVVLLGAGVSTAAGIPDFRSAAVGLYAQISQQYPDLPSPMSIFDLEYFKSNPLPFYDLAMQIVPHNIKPTETHYFVSLLSQMDKLLCCITQNIDGLEEVAGIPEEKLITAHGDFKKLYCASCGKNYSPSYLNIALEYREPLFCTQSNCFGVLKPSVVFFGEPLPSDFSKAIDYCSQADLVIIIGTSLKVFPFAALPSLVSPSASKVVVNKERVDASGFDFDGNDSFVQGEADEVFGKVIDALDWSLNFEQVKTQFDFNGDLFHSFAPPFDPIVFKSDDLIFVPDNFAPFHLNHARLAVLPFAKLKLPSCFSDCSVEFEEEYTPETVSYHQPISNSVLGVLVKGDVEVLKKEKQSFGLEFHWVKRYVWSDNSWALAFVPTSDSFNHVVTEFDPKIPVRNVSAKKVARLAFKCQHLWKFIGSYSGLHWSLTFKAILPVNSNDLCPVNGISELDL
ncbi:hypothetical protein P9112_004243 [Eukaryota sp. TZLM1-RC]